MFAGIDDIDWAGMEHAYGSAERVPDWLRGLVDPDPGVRDAALGAMVGCVHHQGDVYDSTVAALPFLIEILMLPGAPGRDGVAELVAGIADLSEWPDDDELGTDDPLWQAHELVVAAAPRLSGLAADPDPMVRAAMTELLVAVAPDVPGSAALLTGMLGAETDPAVSRALLEALGRLELGAAEIDRLLVLAGHEPASVAVSALVAVAEHDPGRVPAGVAAGLLERAYAEVGEFGSDPLVGEKRDEPGTVRRAPHCARLVEALTDPLGHRVTERLAIIAPLLASPHPDLAGDALFAVNRLIERWRGDYRDAVVRVGELLAGPDRMVVERAESMLDRWGPVAAPAVEAIAGRLAVLEALPWRNGLPAFAQRFADRPGIRPCVRTLAGFGDERALPALLVLIRLPVRPRGLGAALARFGGHAERIVDALITGLDPAEGAVLGRAFGPAAAPLVPGLLAGPMTADVAAALGRIGAVAALPALRAGLYSDDPRTTVAAAGALWRIERSPLAIPALIAQLGTRTLPSRTGGRTFPSLHGGAAPSRTGGDAPLLTRARPGRRVSARDEALAALGEIGPDAAVAVPHMVPLLAGNEKARAAMALWRITGDAALVTPALTAAWCGDEHTRRPIAETATGALAAALAPLFRAELTEVRRHALPRESWGSNLIHGDEELLRILTA